MPPATPVKPTQRDELDRITALIEWAHQKGALHIKTPYIEMVFPPSTADKVSVVEAANRVAEEEILHPRAVYKNPLDDPDYYAEQQEHFYGRAVKPSEPR